MKKIITTLCIAGASLFSTATAAELTNYTLDPAAGSTVESLSEIKITFPDRDSDSGYFFTFDDTKGYITNGTDTIPTSQISVRLTENYKIITFVKKDTGIEATITTPGEWTLYLAPGAFFLWDYDHDDDDNVEESPAITATYTIGEVGGGVDTTPSASNLTGWVSDPEDGAVISSFDRLNVCFPYWEMPDNGGWLKPNTDKISVTDGTTTYKVYYGSNNAGYPGMQSKGFYAINEDGEEITLGTGTYTWTFAKGAFQSIEWGDDDDIVLAESAAFSITLTVGEAPVEKSPYNLSKWISDPESGATLDKLGRVTVSFPDFEPADWGFLKVNKNKVSISDGKKDYEFFYGMPATGYAASNSKGFYAENEDGEEITLTAPGTYTWAFEAGAFQSLDEDDNVLAESEAFTITYTIEGAGDPLEYTVDPASGSTVDFPAGDLTVTYTFANATSVSAEAFEVDSNVGGGADSRGIRVTYGTEPLARLEALTAGAHGYTLTADGNKLVYTFSHDIFAANGTLKISADEGTYGVDGQHGPALEYTLKVGQAKDYTYTITPESGAEATEFATFTITFPEATTATFTEGSYVVLNGPRMLTQYSCTQVEGAEHPTFELTFDPAPYVAGTYSLSVEAGSFTLDGKFASPAIRGSYTLLRSTDVDTTILSSPLGSKVVATEYGTYVGFVFAEDEDVTYDRATYESNIVVKFDDTTLKMGSDYIFKLSTDGSQYKIEIYMEGSNPYVGKTGTLSVSIAEGTFSISGEPSPAISKTWQVIAPRTYDWTSDPADGSTTSSLAEITITFLEAEEAEVYLNSFVNLRDTEYLYWGFLTESYSKTTEEGAAVTLVFDPAPTEDGEYVLSCDYSAFVIDGGIETPNMDLHFFLDKNAGVGTIELTDGLYTVYSIDGRLVLDKAEHAALKTLEPGFYIINGKKTAIK